MAIPAADAYIHLKIENEEDKSNNQSNEYLVEGQNLMVARGPSFHGGVQANAAKPRLAAKSLTGKSPVSGTQGTENLSALGWGDMPHKYDKLSHTKTQSPNNK